MGLQCRRLFLDPFCGEGFFWTLFVWWDVPKKPWQCGGRCQTYGFPFDLASWASSVEGFFWTLFVCEGFFGALFVWWDVRKSVRRMGSHLRPVRRLFLDPFCVVGRSKKNLGSVGAGVPFSGQVFFRPFWNSALSDVWVPVWLGLMGLQCRRLFLDPFCVRRFFLDPFCVVGRSKKNLGSGGAGVPFSGQASF